MRSTLFLRGLLPVVVLLLAGAAGCGGGSKGGKASSPGPMPSSAPQAFPSGRGRSLSDLLQNVPRGPNLVPSVSTLEPGPNRFGFILVDNARKQITGAPVALYTSARDGSSVKGPFMARTQSLGVEPRFLSRTAGQDPNSAKSIYTARLPFSGRGVRGVMALAQLDGRLVATQPQAVAVGAPGPPKVGQPAIRIHTPTTAEVHGDLSKIDTRVPPDDMHKVDFASVLGRKPVVLIFATPRLCQSRTCAPLVDEAMQVESRYRGRVEFIHMEVYNQNDVSKGYRPQFRAWHLPSEPWIFGVDRAGRVADRLDGPASVAEIDALARRTLRA